MRFRIPAARALLLVGLLGAAACGDDDPTEPVDVGGDVLGTWTAVSFSGAQLPIEEFVFIEDRGTCARTLEDVQLTFLNTGTYTWEEESTLECDGSPPETINNLFTGPYRVEDIKLIMADSETPDDEFESTFSVLNNTLTLRQRLGNLTLTSVFSRG
jgi:hypothetical protein